MTVTMDFNSFIYLLYIPIIALAGWLVLNTKQYLVSEYLVASIYSLAHFSILSFPISLAILIFFPENYLSFSYPIILIMALYTAYVLNRIHGRNILRTLVYFLLFSIGFFGLGLLLNIILLLTGVITIQELMPKA